MCLAVLKTAGGPHMTQEEIANAWGANSDGAGIGIATGDGFQIYKFKHLEQLQKKMKELRGSLLGINAYVLHFRLATHGLKDKANIHPFYVNEDLIMAHNGIIDVGHPTEKNSNMSDSAIFAKYVLGHLPKNFWKNPGAQWLIDQAIGRSKIILLHKSGDYYISNSELGYWEHEHKVWYSNTSHRYTLCSSKSRVIYSPYGSHHWGGPSVYNGSRLSEHNSRVNKLISGSSNSLAPVTTQVKLPENVVAEIPNRQGESVDEFGYNTPDIDNPPVEESGEVLKCGYCEDYFKKAGSLWVKNDNEAYGMSPLDAPLCDDCYEDMLNYLMGTWEKEDAKNVSS